MKVPVCSVTDLFDTGSDWILVPLVSGWRFSSFVRRSCEIRGQSAENWLAIPIADSKSVQEERYAKGCTFDGRYHWNARLLFLPSFSAIFILGLFGYLVTDGSPTSILALGGVQLPLPLLQWSEWTKRT